MLEKANAYIEQIFVFFLLLFLLLFLFWLPEGETN